MISYLKKFSELIIILKCMMYNSLLVDTYIVVYVFIVIINYIDNSYLCNRNLKYDNFVPIICIGTYSPSISSLKLLKM